MADVFVSYASEDRDHAHRLADAFNARGWSVWWDRKLIAGQNYDTIIEHELESARCVVVLWSAHSIASDWVKSEAGVGRERGVLVPAMLEAVKLPLEFRRKQTADLSGWTGELTHDGFIALADGVATVLGDTRSPSDADTIPKPERPLRSALIFFGVLLSALALGWLVLQMNAHHVASGQEAEMAAQHDPAAIAAGSYDGDVTADSQGSSHPGVALRVTRVNARKVRIESDYARIGSEEVELIRIDDTIMNNGGRSTFLLDLSKTPPRLDYNPRGELAYSGTSRAR